jgi:hypothetical protein
MIYCNVMTSCSHTDGAAFSWQLRNLSIGVLYKSCDHILRRLEKTGRQVILMVNFYLCVFQILHMKHMCICFTVVWV